MADNCNEKSSDISFAGFPVPLIELGRVVVTRAVLEHLEREAADIQPYLSSRTWGLGRRNAEGCRG